MAPTEDPETRRGITVVHTQDIALEFKDASQFITDDNGELRIYQGARCVCVYAAGDWARVWFTGTK